MTKDIMGAVERHPLREEVARLIDPAAGWGRLGTLDRLSDQRVALRKADDILSLPGLAGGPIGEGDR